MCVIFVGILPEELGERCGVSSCFPCAYKTVVVSSINEFVSLLWGWREQRLSSWGCCGIVLFPCVGWGGVCVMQGCVG